MMKFGTIWTVKTKLAGDRIENIVGYFVKLHFELLFWAEGQWER